MSISRICGLGLVLTGVLASGCGGDESEDSTSPAQPSPAQAVQPTADISTPTPVAPPPPGAASVGTPVGQATPEAPEMTVPSKDALEVVTMATQSFFIANDRAPKSLDELVSSGYLKRLPVPPVGKKYVYDAENAKLSLADQ
ncbi:MAG TPA: hypothetical protein VGH19_09680 [Verrucomicrobiae bacterium]